MVAVNSSSGAARSRRLRARLERSQDLVASVAHDAAEQHLSLMEDLDGVALCHQADVPGKVQPRRAHCDRSK